MTVQESPPLETEPRWPPIAAIVLAALLVGLLPARYAPTPWWWFPWVSLVAVVGPMMAVTLVPGSLLLHRIERAVLLALFGVIGGLNVISVGRLVADMITHKHGYTAITLLESATEIWTVNVIVFAILYWQVDRAGPEARAAGAGAGADFHFADERGEGDSGSRPPRFVDYLYLAFVTSTSFAPPDYSRPASERAKLFLMAQATISLVTLFLIASRAIATLS